MTLRLATLGPKGSNHSFVAERYLAALGVSGDIVCFDAFPAAFHAMFSGDVDHVLQVAVHPTVPEAVGGAYGTAHLIDSFLSPSQAMAVLTRRDSAPPRSIGLVPPTLSYIDAARWETVVDAQSTVAAWEGLQAGAYDSALTLARFAEIAPDRFRVDVEIPPVTDAWLIYGRAPLAETAIWTKSPGAAMLRE